MMIVEMGQMKGVVLQILQVLHVATMNTSASQESSVFQNPSTVIWKLTAWMALMKLAARLCTFRPLRHPW